jgi:hypothetical protein
MGNNADRSKAATAVVALWISTTWHRSVVIPSVTDDRLTGVDLVMKGETGTARIAVKWREVVFHSLQHWQSYAFGHSGFFLDRKDSYERKIKAGTAPHRYISVSADWGGIAVHKADDATVARIQPKDIGDKRPFEAIEVRPESGKFFDIRAWRDRYGFVAPAQRHA